MHKQKKTFVYGFWRIVNKKKSHDGRGLNPRPRSQIEMLILCKIKKKTMHPDIKALDRRMDLH